MTAISSSLGEQRTVELAEGAIEYRERGAGPPLVFVHGILANGDIWRDVVPELATSYRCITPDWPLGAHRRGMRDGTDWTLPGCAGIVARFLEALDLEDVTLVGNDTGGAIAQWVAVRHPERIGRLVLTPCDAFKNFPPFVLRHFRITGRSRTGLWLLGQGLRFRAVQQMPLALGRLTERPIPAEIVRSYTRWIRESPDCRRDFSRMVAAISPRFTEEAATQLPEFDKPVLVVWALERRRFFPVDHAHRLVDLFPDARLRLVEDSGPFVTEDQPIQTADHIAQFLRETTSTAPPVGGTA